MKHFFTFLLVLFYLIGLSQTAVVPPTDGIYGGPSSGDDGIVGNLKGSFTTSASGAMIYSIPILCPTGPGGLKPDLSLVYNSQGGNGIMGIGWNIGGLSAITRGGHNIHMDAKVQGVEFAGDDKLLLDGNRLEVINNITYGNNGAIYCTRNETFSKIAGYSTNSSGTEWFEVKTRNGLIYEYGNTGDSRIEVADGSSPIIQKWLINKITDLNGYSIEFNYLEDPIAGEVVLENIQYSINRNQSLSYIYSINFTYNLNGRADQYYGYLNGSKSSIVRRLSKIEVKYMDEPKFVYELEYKVQGITAPFYSYLKEIKLKASKFEEAQNGIDWFAKRNGSTIEYEHFNPLEIEWTEEGTCSFGSSNVFSDFSYDDGYGSAGSSVREIGDFNGDGKQDILGVEPGSDEFDVALSNGNNFNASTNWISNATIAQSCNVQIYDWGTNFGINAVLLGHNYLAIGDVNGDGLDDVVGFNSELTVLLVSNGSGFTIEDYFFDYDPNRGYKYILGYSESPRMLADVNGDGRADLVSFTDNHVYVSLSIGNSFAAPQVWSSNYGIADGYYYDETHNVNQITTLGDVNGDGMVDIVGFGANNALVSLSDGQQFNMTFSISEFTPAQGWERLNEGDYVKHIRTLADVNGDGLSDIVGFKDDEVIVALSKGNSFEPSYSAISEFGYADYGYYSRKNLLGNIVYEFDSDKTGAKIRTHRTLADVNGDGKVDIVGFDLIGVMVATSDGKLFKTNNTCSSYGNGYWSSGYSVAAKWPNAVDYPRTTGDFNGDGISDILGFGHEQLAYSFSDKNRVLVNKTKDSYDSEERIEYTLLSDATSVYTKGSGAQYPLMDFQAPLYVVKSYDSDAAHESHDYFYQEAIVHKEGFGFLGFNQVKVYVNEVSVTTQNTIHPTHYYMYPSNIDRTIGGHLVEQLTLSNQLVQNSTHGMSYFHYANQIDSKEYYKDSPNSFKRSTVTLITMDQYGNVTDKNAYYSANLNGGPYDYQNLMTTTYSNSTGTPYLLGMPTEIISTQVSPNNSNDIQKVEYTYDTNFPQLIVQKKSTPNNDASRAVSETYGYNSYSQLTGKSTGNYSEQYVYNMALPFYGRFLTSKIIDPGGLAFTTNYEYNPVIGVTVKETDINGLETNFSYNGFGSNTVASFIDGTESHNVLRWANGFVVDLTHPIGDEPAETCFYSWSATSGNSPSITFYKNDKLDARNVEFGFNGESIYIENIYNPTGKISSRNLPYFSSSSPVVGQSYSYNINQDIKEISDVNNYYYKYTYSDDEITIKKYDVNNLTPLKSNSKKFNFMNQLIESTDQGGTISYDYFSSGSPKTISYNGSVTSFLYDNSGNRISITDPNAGTITSEYDKYGMLTLKTDAKGIITNYTYDILGRLVEKHSSLEDETVVYTYDNAANIATSNPPSTKGLLASVDLENNTKAFSHHTTYDYDVYNRLAITTENIDGTTFESRNTYNLDGKQDSYQYPSGLIVHYDYNSDGFMFKISNYDPDIVYWEKTGANAFQQPTGYELADGNIPVNMTYDEQYLNTITAGQSGSLIQDLEYGFDKLRGNLTYRQDNNFQMKEEFLYDPSSRLYNYTITDLTNNNVFPATEIKYENDPSNLGLGNGNIEQKTDVGDYEYNGPRPNAVTEIENPITLPSEPLQITEFNHLNKIDRIHHTSQDKELQFYYGSNQQRAKTVFVDNVNAREQLKYFTHGSYEFEVNDGAERGLSYINSPDGLICIVEDDGQNIIQGQNANVLNSNYILKDHLGSIYALVDETGAIRDYQGDIQIFSFDPWGKRRSYSDWSLSSNTSSLFTDRGYTGHQMLDEFGLINMNGRIYDPVIARFFSPDPFVQAPNYTQNYNRYSYCYNNPLKYSDPSGEFVHILIGAGIGGLVNLGYQAYKGNINSFTDGAVAFGIGAVAGGVGAATGGAAFAAMGAGAGAAAGGGGFVVGAIGGMAASAASMPIQSAGNSLYFGDPFMTPGEYAAGIAFGGLLGGTINGGIAAYNGRSFWNGGSKVPWEQPMSSLPNLEAPVAKLDPVPRSVLSTMDDVEFSYSMGIGDDIGNLAPEIRVVRPNIKINGYVDDVLTKGGKYHQYPYAFDKDIAQYGAVGQRLKDQAYFINQPGTVSRTVNGVSTHVDGFYTLGVTKSGIVYHRCFYDANTYKTVMKNFSIYHILPQ